MKTTEFPFSKVQSKPGCLENWDGQTWLQRTGAGSSGGSKNIFDNDLPVLNAWMQAGHIITCFHYPSHPNFNFEAFYTTLGERGFMLYAITVANCFLRSGHLPGKSYRCFVFPNWQHWQPGGGRHGHPTYPHSGCPRRDGHTYSGVIIIKHRFDCLISLYSSKYIFKHNPSLIFQ